MRLAAGGEFYAGEGPLNEGVEWLQLRDPTGEDGAWRAAQLYCQRDHTLGSTQLTRVQLWFPPQVQAALATPLGRWLAMRRAAAASAGGFRGWHAADAACGSLGLGAAAAAAARVAAAAAAARAAAASAGGREWAGAAAVAESAAAAAAAAAALAPGVAGTQHEAVVRAAVYSGVLELTREKVKVFDKEFPIPSGGGGGHGDSGGGGERFCLVPMLSATETRAGPAACPKSAGKHGSLPVGWATGPGVRCFGTVPDGGGECRRTVGVAAEALMCEIKGKEHFFV
jgi:hypothetical protein